MVCSNKFLFFYNSALFWRQTNSEKERKPHTSKHNMKEYLYVYEYSNISDNFEWWENLITYSHMWAAVPDCEYISKAQWLSFSQQNFFFNILLLPFRYSSISLSSSAFFYCKSKIVIFWFIRIIMYMDFLAAIFI